MQFKLSHSEGFTEWLAKEGVTLGVSSHQANALMTIGTDEKHNLSINTMAIERCTGLSLSGSSLAVGSFSEVICYEKMPRPVSREREISNREVYAPQKTLHTGVFDLHELARENSGRLVGVNTLFNCIVSLEDEFSFSPLWTPPFLKGPIAGDRCHLNGLALHNGKARWCSMVGVSGEVEGWREFRSDGGSIWDMSANEMIAQGLSMPHSPCLWNNQLLVLNAGTGELGAISLKTGDFERIAWYPGFLRGMYIHNDLAFIGLSLPRDGKTYQGLPIQERCEKTGQNPMCGLVVCDLKSGKTEHWLQFKSNVTEIFDLVVMPESPLPKMVSLHSEDRYKHYSIGPRQA
ncbi:TIGR03032 family protein [Kiloniella sp.]|uniref:TIGR03032 family protein n=1 Tax=Kiloniella sp. TaxID=1938587 RepID=UPI003B01BF01